MDVLDRLTHAAVRVTESTIPGLWTVAVFTPDGRRVAALDRESRGDAEMVAAANRAALGAAITDAVRMALGGRTDGG